MKTAVERVTVRVLPDGRLNRKNTALYLGCTEKTLAQWELQKRGPESVKVAGRRFYYLDGLNDFIKRGNRGVMGGVIPVDPQRSRPSFEEIVDKNQHRSTRELLEAIWQTYPDMQIAEIQARLRAAAAAQLEEANELERYLAARGREGAT